MPMTQHPTWTIFTIFAMLRSIILLFMRLGIVLFSNNVKFCLILITNRILKSKFEIRYFKNIKWYSNMQWLPCYDIKWKYFNIHSTIIFHIRLLTPSMTINYFVSCNFHDYRIFDFFLRSLFTLQNSYYAEIIGCLLLFETRGQTAVTLTRVS